MSHNTQAVVLAAGRSTRFKRKKSKLLAKICGRPMVAFPLKVLERLHIHATVVLGHQADAIKEAIAAEHIQDVACVLQEKSIGTADAVLCSKKHWTQDNILILNADVPLLTEDLVVDLLERHAKSGAVLSFLSTHVFNPKGYGRVVEEDGVTKIYEEKGCPEQYRDVTKVNAGVYVIKRSFLEESLGKVEKDVVSGEFYLTDLLALASEQGHTIQAIPTSFDAVRGVNTLQELWEVEQVLRAKLIKHWMDNGVRFELAQSIHLDLEVEIGAGSFIGTGAHILGKSKIGEDCFVGAFSIIDNTTIGDEVTVHSHSVIQDSALGQGSAVGPFARLRHNACLAQGAHIGNFVEVKNSTVGQGSKAKHLAYIGDAQVGKTVNIGAGTVFCNYDGFQKSKTIIKDSVFIGSNSTLIAPVEIAQGAYTAAGSVINKDVPEKALAIARARQENKEGYVAKLEARGKKKTT